MITNPRTILAAVLALGLFEASGLKAQQPAPPPPSESGWRKFGNGQSAQPPSDAAAPAPAPAPAVAPVEAMPDRLVLAAGTWITIRVNDILSSERNQAGDMFSATLSQPLIANGYVVARRGQTLGGRVAEVVKGGRTKGTARLGLTLTELSLVDGRQLPVQTQLIQYASGTSKGRDATAIATTTGMGAAIGAAAAGGFGAGLGAAAGAAASTIGVLVTKGRAAEVYPEAALTFRLMEAVTIDTSTGRLAFRPVGQQDYEPRLVQRAPAQQVIQQPVFVGLGGGYGWGPGWGPGWGWPYYYGRSYYRPHVVVHRHYRR